MCGGLHWHYVGVINFACALSEFLPVDLLDERVIVYGSVLVVLTIARPAGNGLRKVRVIVKV